jgi:hypothetical protein
LWTEIGVAPPAPLARHAADSRLNGNAPPDKVALHTFAYLDHSRRELVTQNQRVANDRIADPSIIVVVKIRPANADREDFEEHLAGAGRQALLIVERKNPGCMKAKRSIGWIQGNHSFPGREWTVRWLAVTATPDVLSRRTRAFQVPQSDSRNRR